MHAYVYVCSLSLSCNMFGRSIAAEGPEALEKLLPALPSLHTLGLFACGIEPFANCLVLPQLQQEKLQQQQLLQQELQPQEQEQQQHVSQTYSERKSAGEALPLSDFSAFAVARSSTERSLRCWMRLLHAAFPLLQVRH